MSSSFIGKGIRSLGERRFEDRSGKLYALSRSHWRQIYSAINSAKSEPLRPPKSRSPGWRRTSCVLIGEADEPLIAGLLRQPSVGRGNKSGGAIRPTLLIARRRRRTWRLQIGEDRRSPNPR